MEYLRTEIDNMFNAMSEGASRTVKILDGLRIFSKVYENDLRKANINDGIDSTLLLLNNLLNRIRIEKNYAQLPLVQCYPGKLNQVFLNIIINAAQAINSKFGKEEGGIISISTSYRGAKVIVSIRDNGTGMEESIARQVFEPFFTTREYSGGAGLGMSIAYHTVRKHQGNIHLNSKPGEGTEFTVELRVDHLVP